MRSLMIVLSIALFGTLLVIYLFRGFSADDPGAVYRPYVAPVPQAYFKTPETAVKRINRLIDEKDWPRLARFYDLSGSDVDVSDLQNGSFFYDETPGFYDETRGGHASGIDRYLHPFAPGASLLEVRMSAIADVFEVDVEFEVDQGDGPAQSLIQTFYLVRNPEGYRLLPRAPEPEGGSSQ